MTARTTSLFLWLVEELRRFEAQSDPDPEHNTDASSRPVRGLRRAAATVAARLDEDRPRGRL
ncbi:MAG: hypothetical protein ACLQHS_19110 [Candidatus Limnocylindrales bacterium]